MVDAAVDQKEKEPVDKRMDFLSFFVTRAMAMKLEKWQKMLSTDENKQIILEFFENPNIKKIVLATNTAGVLYPAYEFSGLNKGKSCYSYRIKPVKITQENIRKYLCRGTVSENPFQDFSIMVNEVFIPMLANPHNTNGWPKVVKKNMEKQIQNLRNNIDEVVGNISNRTILPLPITIKTVMNLKPKIDAGDIDACSISIKESLEEIVLKWSISVEKILKQTPDQIFAEKKYPTPSDEFEFWNSRYENLKNIYEQLCDERVKTIAIILEQKKSIYFNTFRLLFKNVIDHLNETKDVSLYLKPLQSQVQKFETTDFNDTKELIQPLMHIMCIVWANSKYYCTNDRMVHMFKLIHNQMIEDAKTSLDPGSIFQGEPDEALATINIIIELLQYYKVVHTDMRGKLKKFLKRNSVSVIWTFKPNTIFKIFNSFLKRLYKIKDIFLVAVEFQKLEKVIIGRLRGREINRILKIILEDFYTLYRNWTNISNRYDLLDIDPEVKHFDRENKIFHLAADELQQKLATQFNLAFDECFTTIQATKLLQILGTIFKQPIIFAEVKHRYEDVVNLFLNELDMVKRTFDSKIIEMNTDNHTIQSVSVDRGLPLSAGTIKWVRQLRGRIEKITDDIPYIDERIFATENGKHAMEQHDSLMKILNEFEHEVFSKWKKEIETKISHSLKRTLLRHDDELLANNFDDECALREIKSFKLMEMEHIPNSAIKFSSREDAFWEARLKLSRIAEWYNAILTDTEKCELNIVRKELHDIDKKLSPALSSKNWSNFDQSYIEEIFDIVKHLHTRVMKTQENLRDCCKSIQSWGSKPLFIRKDNNNEALLDISHTEKILDQRFRQCYESKKLIDKTVNDANYRLFFDVEMTSCQCSTITDSEEEVEGDEDDELDKTLKPRKAPLFLVPFERSKLPESTPEQAALYHEYKIYCDKLIGDELMKAIDTSMRYIKFEIENRLEHDAALFEVLLELQPPHIVFIPNLNDNSSYGFITIIEGLITDIYCMSDVFPRIVQPENDIELPKDTVVDNNESQIITYESILSQNIIIEEIRNDIFRFCKQAIKLAIKHIEEYDKYKHLWITNKQEYLDRFLIYARGLTEAELTEMKENPEFKIKESKPTLDNFKDEIDYYKNLVTEIEKIPDYVDFNVFFRLKCKGFKNRLIIEIQNWGLLFKDYLKNQVINGLQELEDFCKEAVRILALRPEKDDLSTILDVLSIINKVEERQMETDRMFEPLKAIVAMLKPYHYDFDNNIYRQFNELPDEWKKVKRMVLNMKQYIAPMKAYQVDLIGKRTSLFETRCKIYRQHFKDGKLFRIPCENVYEHLSKTNEDIKKIEEIFEALKDSTELFNLTHPDPAHIVKCRKDVKLLKQLWDFVYIIQSSITDWKKTAWKKIDVEAMEQECKKFGKELRLLDKEMRLWDPYIDADASLKNLMTSLRAVTSLQNPAIRTRHWTELMDTTHVRFDMTDETTLADLLALQLHKYEEDVKNIVDKSVKEQSMEKALKDISNTWTGMEFEYDVHHRTNLKMPKVSEEMVEILEDHQVQLQTMLSSKFIGYFQDEVVHWQNLLSNADSVIDAWFDVQRKWMYQESIFIGSEDIRKQLPEDSKRFDTIHSEFKGLLTSIVNQPNVVKSTNVPRLYEKLENLQEMLGLCEKALNDYLETKRLAFPRFYFVSSADLLDILSNGNQPKLVARHLTKLYDSLAKLHFSGTSKSAHAMESKENEEVVKFKKSCDCSGQVEIWLNRVTDSMTSTLHKLFHESVTAYEDKARDAWIFDWPAQPALCTTQIWWTAETNAAFGKLEEGYENALKDYQKKQINQLNALIMLLLGSLTPGERQKIMTVCTIDVHSRDVVAKLITMKIENSLAFQWQCQLRHRWDQKLDNCYVNICDAQFRYDFEYLGNTPRLVITPLTDRCYITLTQSLHLIMGGAPAGPAGTGKTETTKDLGKGLGIMVYVFNCSEQMDYKSCGNIYKGLSQTGAWGCFDEFNRIAIEVLSVVAVQVKSILDAIKTKQSRFLFLGEIITLIPTVGMFITMNPGYAGRTELPENLKALFRPCAMVVPDFALISEIMLVAEGFQDARLLSRKFITLYTLCKELLSKQDHYDWGLRAIKSVLVVAGGLKRDERDRPEDQVLMRALRDFNIPKIVTEDVPIFMGLIGDLFPNLDVPRKRNMDFEKIIRKSAIDLKYQPEDGFVLKVVQLEELFAVRHSVFVVGFSGTGKSAVWKTLNRTYYNQQRKPHFNDLNPKAVTNDELFGIINPTTREWKDGLFSVIMRDQANMHGNGPKWIILDGDIDPMWIESLNTLMDDNKILTLASNERIALTKEMRLLFEIATLRTATPATVSRAGILYINPQDLGWSPFVQSWVDTREIANEKSMLTLLFEKYIPPLLDVMKLKLKKITPISDIAMIQMTCYLLDCLLVPKNVPADCPKEWYELYFVFAIIWGFGSALFQDQIIDWRNEFSKWWTSENKAVRFPSGGNIFNYYIDSETKSFLPWNNLVQSFELNPDIPLQSTLVNTAETTSLRYFIDILIAAKHPVMLVGGAGSGKSVIMADKLNTLSLRYDVTNVPFNFYTTSEMLQQVLEKPLEKKAGKNFGPPGNKTMIYFIDDMNMPEVDLYGTVQPHTLVRQFMDYQHWYDRSKLILKDIHNCQFVSCMNPTAGSFTINPRLQRHFCTFAVNFPGNDAMYHIYYSILSQHIQNPINKIPPKVLDICEPLIKTAIILHQRMGQMFLPTAVKFHYNFNLRDMANIFSGMMYANGDCCPNTNMLLRLWIHEAKRVYGDKLVSFTDLDAFDKLTLEVVRKGIEDFNEELVFQKPHIFFHFADGLNDSKYMPVKEWSALNNILEEAQTGYNEFVGSMNLVLFEDAMAHICRIVRILSSDRGYALLIGVGGSGKQSLTRLAAFIASLDVYQTQLRKGFTIANLKEDLLAIYVKTGAKNSTCCYLMTDSQVSEEHFLVLINDLLASGEIPDLFPPEDIDDIIGAVRNEAKQAGIVDTKENCWKFFIEKVRRMLKVVLCFSPVGSTLRVRSRKFPAIVNCTSIDWFHEWPRIALESVSKRFLKEIDVLPPEFHVSVSNFMAYVHGTVNDMSKVYFINERRYNYTTPKSFLELISLYAKLLKDKHKELTDRIERLENGLLKLADCANQVDGLQEQLKEQEVVLSVKRVEAEKQHAIVSAENEIVGKEKSIASEKEKEIRLIEEDVTVKTKVCTEELKKVEPLMIAATAALDTLDKNNLTELKSFGSPPAAVVNVVSAVIILFSGKGKIPKDRTWKVGKVMMGKVDKFLDDLKNFKKKEILPETIKAVQPYLDDPEFDPVKVRAKSEAAAGICEWVINIKKFYDVYLIVGPMERALNQAEAELAYAQKTLAELNVRLEALQEKLDVLQAKLDEAAAEKEKCQAEADKTEFTIQLAHRLVDGLASEKIRWRESVKNLNEQIITLPGDILLISCFISYVGCFTRRYRLDLLNKRWLPTFKKIEPVIPVSEASDPLAMVCDDAQIAAWNNEGLPSDKMSSENATILTNSARWPLIIDPQLQGIKWIKQKYGNGLIVIRLTMPSYLDKIEQAISNGNVVLIENIGESIDAVLDPLLGRVLIKKGTCMKIGEREIDYNPKFKLILHTKLANPHYKPEMQAQTTLINFTVTRDGLEDQLLAEVVKAERPDLETLKSELTTQQNTFKITLKTLEDDLLHRLSTAGENVLEDPTLVLNLEKTKKTAAEIEIKVVEAKETSIKIDEARELYRASAERASILYFILNDLVKVNMIYQFSLKAFTVVFNKAILNTPEGETLTIRLANLLDSISYATFMYTSRALFERDKLIFLAHMTIQILLQAEAIDPLELDFLLRFPYIPNVTSPVEFIGNVGWGGIKALANMDAYQNLDKDIEGYAKRWKQYTESDAPEHENLPGEWKNKKTLQRLCIIRCLRPDRMTYAIRKFVEMEMGSKYVEARMTPFSQTFEETSNQTHTFFTLSPGVDPLKDVEKLGVKMKYMTRFNNFHNVSLGQGQEIVAEKAIDLAAANGHWVILQNIHLVAKWLPTLEKKIEATIESSHENYRLFVSAEPAASAEYHIIPQGVLDSAIKITNEPPTGMMANLHKALDNFNQETLEMCSKEAEFKAILFSLCYFHAVVAERQKFGPQGWNRIYPFNFGDLTISTYVLHNYLEANNRVPWEDLRYLFGEIMYGGHITDDWDRRLCRTYLEEYMHSDLIDGDLYFAPGFLAPPNTDYVGYHTYIDSALPKESPTLYGLHSNAEIGVLTTVSEELFKTVFELQPRDSGSSGGSAMNREEIVKQLIEDICDKIPEEFNMIEIMARVEDRTPYIIVAFQECDRMNMLMREIKRSLSELNAGLKGELTITSDMETLEESLHFDVVPPSWTKLAYPSLLGLQAWFADLILRLRELEAWAADFNLPATVWLAGFFNPQSFLTAIMQQTARRNSWPLDRMCLNCDVTRKQKSDFTAAPREGAYIQGMFMEGARWDLSLGSITDSIPKELFPSMPVIYIKAVTQDKQDVKNVYECPVYKIRMRGPTFVWTFNLKTKAKPSKWTMAGVCLLLQV